MFFDDLDFFPLCLRLLHTTGIGNETLHGVIAGRVSNHLDLFPLFFCLSQAGLIGCDTLDRFLGLPDRLVNGLVDVRLALVLCAWHFR